MDDAVLGLVWVTSVCIFGHIATAMYFSKIIRSEASEIDERIAEIDHGLGSMAQWMMEKFENSSSPNGIDWGNIISQIFQAQKSPHDHYNRSLNGQFNGAKTYEESEWTEEVEGVVLDPNS
jgi:hypothetical protein